MAIEMIDPLDYLILGALPEAGTLVLGVYPDGKTSKQIAEEVLHSVIEPTHAGRRLAELRKAGMVVTVKAPKNTSGGFIWQRTASGKRIYKEWKASQGGEAS